MPSSCRRCLHFPPQLFFEAPLGLGLVVLFFFLLFLALLLLLLFFVLLAVVVVVHCWACVLPGSRVGLLWGLCARRVRSRRRTALVLFMRLRALFYLLRLAVPLRGRSLYFGRETESESPLSSVRSRGL